MVILEKWRPLNCIGSRPLPRCGHTFTSIDKNRAVLIGGLDSQGPFKDAFMFKLNTAVILLAVKTNNVLINALGVCGNKRTF